MKHDSTAGQALRGLPRVDNVLREPVIAALSSEHGAARVRHMVREELDLARRAALDAAALDAEPTSLDLTQLVARVAKRAARAHLFPRRVINATGVVLHTGLGRAPLGGALADHAQLAGYSDLELDLDTGERSQRGSALAQALAVWLGAEAAMFTNNNAAAVLLCLTEMARGREVLVSRGELIEIGGGFRIPDMLELSGAKLIEVGTTNRTRLSDYAAALSERTACILRVHPSNFHIQGFTERPKLREVARLAADAGIPLLKDLGGGLVVESAATAPSGQFRDQEPSVQACLRDGADVVCFSLDKLFGGPQGGAVVGAREWLARFRKHPLARVARVGKLTLGALAPTIQARVSGRHGAVELERMLALPEDELRSRAQRWLRGLPEFSDYLCVRPHLGAVGGGTLPGAELPSAALVVSGVSARHLSELLRSGPTPTLSRLQDEQLWLDARTPLLDEDDLLVASLRASLFELQRREAGPAVSEPL